MKNKLRTQFEIKNPIKKLQHPKLTSQYNIILHRKFQFLFREKLIIK
jgi:hypothetical protein